MTNPCRLPLRPRVLASALESLLGLKPLARVYDDRPPNCDPFEFLDHALDALGIDVAIDAEKLLDEIPKTGPVLIVANHPLGGLEGMAIAKVIG
ncbi:MAG: hemolysin, partial [Pseudomonadota bacterium]|nr:hemolysin [Pseudomonadota bacterium]